MDRQEIDAERSEAVSRLFDIAYQEVLAMHLPRQIELPEKLLGLGKQNEKVADRLQESLISKYGEQLPELISTVVHQYWCDCWVFAANIASMIESGTCEDDEITRGWTTATGYADFHGWAATLVNSYWSRNEIKDAEPRFATKSIGHFTIDLDTAMKCMVVYWFHQAAMQQAQGRIEAAFNTLGEAYAGVTLLNDRPARRIAIDDAKLLFESEIRSSIGRKGADAIHTETRNLKREVEEYWRSNVERKLPNDAAADILTRHFPLKHRTLSKYVSEFKKAVCQ